MLPLKLLDEVVDKTVVEILTTQVSVTSRGFDFENTLLDGEERDIERSSAQIEDEDVPFTDHLLVETIGDRSSGRFVDDTEDVESGNRAGILGCLTLGIIEICGNGDDSVGNGGAEIRLCRFLHLQKYHGGDFFGRLKNEISIRMLVQIETTYEFLLLATVLDFNVRLASLVDDLEGEMLHIGLDFCVLKLATDQTLSIEYAERDR